MITKLSSRYLLLIISLFQISSCAPSSVLSAPGAYGALAGASLGAGGASYWASKDSSVRKGPAMIQLGLIGAAMGLVAGGTYYEDQVNSERAIYRVRRVLPKTELDVRDRIIHDTSYAVSNSTKWGQGETKSFEERYLDHEPREPFQGEK